MVDRRIIFNYLFARKGKYIMFARRTKGLVHDIPFNEQQKYHITSYIT